MDGRQSDVGSAGGCDVDTGTPATPLHLRSAASHPPSQKTLDVVQRIQNSTPSSASPSPSSGPSAKRRLIYQNGFAKTPQTPSYKPFGLPRPLKKRKDDFSPPSQVEHRPSVIKAIGPPSDNAWRLAEERLLQPGQGFRAFQKEATSAILARRDVTVIAPTGVGKSLLFVLPLLFHSDGIVLVITPLTALAREQTQFAADLGFRSVFISKSAGEKPPIQDTAAGKYQVVFCCPEMLECPTFAPILHSTSFQQRLTHVAVDEAHCIVEMGGFRPAYTRLSLLRHILSKANPPVLQMSATLPPRYLIQTNSTLGIQANALIINIGNYRPELSTVVLPIEHPGKDFKDLAKLLQLSELLPGCDPTIIPKTIIYADDITLITELFWWLRSELVSRGLPAGLVDVYHSGLSDAHKAAVHQDFTNDDIKFLIPSDALGCGTNYKGVRRVIQFKCSGLTLSQLRQRFGRGARDAGSTSIGYLLFEKSLSRGGKLSPTAPGPEDVGVLELIQLDDCCEDIFERYFGNPPRLSGTTGTPSNWCCNRCNPLLVVASQQFIWIQEDFSENPKLSSVVTPAASKEAKLEIRAHLINWRRATWASDWKTKWPHYSPKTLLSDRNLDSIINNISKIHSLADLEKQTQILHWPELGESLLHSFQEACNTAMTGAAQSLTSSNSQPAENSQVLPEPPVQPSMPEYTRQIALNALSLSIIGGSVRGRPYPAETFHEGESVFSVFG